LASMRLSQAPCHGVAMTVEQVCGLGKKQGTQGDFRRESLQGLKKGISSLG
jgi:hypothetical protein